LKETRKIKIVNWKAKSQDGEELEENLLMGLNVFIANKKPDEILRGIDKFRLFGRLAKAFEKAEKTKILELEEGDYSFLKTSIERDIPSTWAINPNTNKAIEDFLDAKEE